MTKIPHERSEEASVNLRGLRKPMDAAKASMGFLTPFPYLTLCAA